jgi:hypothetical protein
MRSKISLFADLPVVGGGCLRFSFHRFEHFATRSCVEKWRDRRTIPPPSVPLTSVTCGYSFSQVEECTTLLARAVDDTVAATTAVSSMMGVTDGVVRKGYGGLPGGGGMSAPGGGGRWKGPRERRKEEEEEEEARRRVSLLSAESVPAAAAATQSPSPIHPSPPPSASPSPDAQVSEEETTAGGDDARVTRGIEVMKLDDRKGGRAEVDGDQAQGQDADMYSPTPQRRGQNGATGDGDMASSSPERGHGREHVPMSVSPQRDASSARGGLHSAGGVRKEQLEDDDDDAMAISPPRVRNASPQSAHSASNHKIMIKTTKTWSESVPAHCLLSSVKRICREMSPFSCRFVRRGARAGKAMMAGSGSGLRKSCRSAGRRAC